MRRFFLAIGFLAAVSLACSTLFNGGPTPTAKPIGVYDGYKGIDPARLGEHTSQFILQFQGESSWRYQVVTRHGRSAIARELHIEGVEDAANPGDVRMVSEDGISRMVGPGTEGQCIQFPEDREVNVSFLGPDDVIAPELMQEAMVEMGTEVIQGYVTQHFALVKEELDGWEEVRIGLWMHPSSGAVLRHVLQVSGWDPFFQGGWGQLDGEFEVIDVGPVEIEGIEGCQVELPLPESHRNLVILPGVIAFETTEGLDEVVSYYRSTLEDSRWERASEEERASGAVVLSYRDGASRLDITIRQMDGYTRVQLLAEGP